MKFGLSEKNYQEIKRALQKFPYKFLIFGSRARGDYKNESDIDLAVLESINDDEKNKIRNELDKLNIIYMIDLVFVEESAKKELIDSIKKEGVEF